MSRGREHLNLAVGLLIACAVAALILFFASRRLFGTHTKEEVQALVYLQSNPVDLEPDRLNYTYLCEKLRVRPHHRVFYAAENAYEAEWFGYGIQATFEGSDEPVPFERAVFFSIGDSFEGHPISLFGVYPGQLSKDAVRAVLQRRPETKFSHVDGKGYDNTVEFGTGTWGISWTCHPQAGDCIITTVRFRLGGYKFMRR